MYFSSHFFIIILENIMQFNFTTKDCSYNILIFIFQPDYYDALDYESKRQKTPRGEKKKVGGPTSTRSSTAGGTTAKMRRFPGTPQNQGRATLAWRKEEDGVKRKVKKGSGGGGGKKEEAEEVGEPVLEDIPTDKVFPCAVSLAEINRKLGVVMWKPVPTK